MRWGRDMSDSNQGTGGLARGIVGSARVTAFGTSIVAPAVSVINVLVVMMSASFKTLGKVFMTSEGQPAQSARGG